jgi:hypothetical protein
MKAIQINNEIKTYSTLPKKWKNHLNFHKASEELQKEEGFYDVVRPFYNTETQYLGDIYWDETNEVFTYPVEDYTEAELEEREQRELDSKDRQFDQEAAKRLLRKVAEPILTDEKNLTEGDLENVKTLYPQWRSTGIEYKLGDKLVYNEEVYKVISDHVSQSDWAPDVANTLFNKYKVAGKNEWDYPVEYEVNQEVTYEGEIYKCIQAHTSQSDWNPADTASLWEIV